MSDTMTSTRRSFLKVGALLAAPMAPAAALAIDGDAAGRLARHEDEAAIRALHRDWLKQANAGPAGKAGLLFFDFRRAALQDGVRGIAADHDAEPGTIRIAPDGNRAEGRFPCRVEIETELAQDCTLAQMAHAQGEGCIRRSEKRMLAANYVKSGGAWAIAKVEFACA